MEPQAGLQEVCSDSTPQPPPAPLWLDSSGVFDAVLEKKDGQRMSKYMQS